MNIILKWVISALAVFFAATLIPGISLSGVWAAIWVALLLGLINVTIKPILIVLTLPINILTLGLFTFVINALMILLVSSVVKGFEVSGFWTAMLFGIVLSVISYILNSLFNTKK